MTFIYVYIKGPSWWNKSGQFNELYWSIKTVEKYYKGARCIVVGDAPGFECEHIPVQRIETASADVRHVDVINKLKAVCELDIDDFVLMYDDIYFLRKISKKDITTPYALCKIEDLNTYQRGKGGLLYTRLWRETYAKIAEMEVELYDWETHLPRYMLKDRVKWLIETFDLMHNNYIISSLYGAMWGENPVLLSENDGIRSHVDAMGPGIDLDKEFSRKFLIIDDNACTPMMTDRIKGLV